MNKEEFGKKVKDLFSKGAEASKEAFEKAGDKVQDFTDKSVLKIEKKQLESKLENKYAEMGKIIAAALESSDKITISDEVVKTAAEAMQAEIKDLQKQIKEKEALL